MTEGSKKQDILRKVQALLAKADSTAFTEEGDTYRQKADELMTLYAIEEFELDAAGGTKRESVTSRTVPVCEAGSVIFQPLVDLAHTIAYHCRCRIVFYNLRGRGKYAVSAKVIGFPSDLDFYELLHTSLHMKIATDLEPKYDPHASEGENVKRMKEAGMKWQRICQLVPGMERAFRDDGSVGPEAIRVYKAECRKQGTEPMKTMPVVYVTNFAAGFVTEIGQRLNEMRHTTEEHIASKGTDLVLFKTREQEVDEEFIALFPKLHHVPAKQSKFNGTARQAGARSGATADLSGGRSAGGGTKGSLESG